jgi:hypothetical protein
MSTIKTEETYKMLTEMAQDEQPMAVLFLSLLKNCDGAMRENLLRQAGEAIYFAHEVARRSNDPEFAAEMMRQAKDGR